jgi:hypothetical protein
MRPLGATLLNSSALAVAEALSSIRYTHSGELLEPGIGFAIQSPFLNWSSYSSGRHGMLFVMVSQASLFDVW